jgi:conjugative transfer ATPase
MFQWLDNKFKDDAATAPLRNSDKAKGYQHHRSLTDEMSIIDWNDEKNVGLLEDGVSLIRFLEIKDIACETLSSKALIELYQKLTALLSHIVPLEDANPWTVSIYCQDDMTLKGLKNRLHHYVTPALKTDAFSQHFLHEVMDDHFKLLCQEEGIFIDPMSGLPFRGRSRRLRMAIYRRHKRRLKGFDYRHDTLNELEEVTDNMIDTLKDKGLAVRTLTGKHIYDWFVRWFNPRPEATAGDVDELLALYPYPEKKPFGWSIIQNAFKSQPISVERGWKFDGLEHRILVFAELENAPKIGVISRERSINGKRAALIDHFPPGSIYTIQMVFESKQTLEKHLDMIEKSAIGRGGEPGRVKRDVAQARDELPNGNLLIRTSQAIFFRGEDSEDLAKKERKLRTLLRNASLKVINTKYNLYPIDTYIRFLPGNYDHTFEKHKMFVSQYLFATDLAALLPFYGRFRGDQLHPLFLFYNRGGEGVIFDPYHEAFKSNNSHIVLFGTSGAGKSVSISYIVMSLLAIIDARVVILEAGGSFDVLTHYLKHHGKKVEHLKFDRNMAIPMNPFMDAYKILEAVEREKRQIDTAIKNKKSAGLSFKIDKRGADKTIIAEHANQQTDEIENLHKLATEKEKKADEDRDVLNEMALIVRCMITGGEKKEEENITRADMGRITKTIIDTVKRCYTAGKEQVLTEDIIEGFLLAAKDDADNATRFKDFAASMTQFITGELANFFNSPAKPTTDFDYLHIDLGFLKDKGQESGLNVVAISVLSRVLGIAEANQFSNRPTIFIMDEAHLLFKNQMIAAFATLMAKVSRKLGLWLMPATQNIEDLKGMETSKLLSMMENWLCLALSEKEIDLIPQFRSLSQEQRDLLSSVKKYPKVYAEGVLLGENYQGLFRNIPPRIALALAMTEQNEKAERRKLCEQFGYTDLEAVEQIAEKLKSYRREVVEDATFDD